MKKVKVLVVLLVIMFAVTVLVGCAPKQPEQPSQKPIEKIKIAFLYIGPVGDFGWTYAHDQARKYLENKFPYVETSYSESVPEGADADRIIDEYCRSGYKIVIANALNWESSMLKAADEYPDVVFLNAATVETKKNLSTFFGKMYEPTYLTGIIAGKMTKSNLIGFVGAHPIPQVIRRINALTLGARSVNPNVKVKVVWTHSWYDPATEKEAALSLINAGCDVIAQHQDSPAAQQAAEENGVWGIGFDADMSKFAPDVELTCPIWHWEKYYEKVVEAVYNGTWKSGYYWGGLKDGIVDLTPLNSKIPEDVQKMVETAKQKIINGSLYIYSGPIYDQNGTLRVKTDERMTEEEVWDMDWFVEGVEGSTE